MINKPPPLNRDHHRDPNISQRVRLQALFFGMLSKHERYYALGMDALVMVCSRNTKVIMVWAWML